MIGVSGGIAAFKVASVVSKLAQSGHHVNVAMSQAATKFVGVSTFAALSGQHVATDIFDSHYPLGAHIELSRNADIYCVAPATADFLSKAASGSGDDLINALYLCFEGPVIVAPSMNLEMWNHKSVQRNLKQLRDDGVHIIQPGEGWLSCRVQGKGRMAEPEEIIKRIESLI